MPTKPGPKKDLEEAKAGQKYGKCPPIATLLRHLQAGNSPTDIARMYGIASTTVYKNIKNAGIDVGTFRDWKHGKADVLSLLQSRIAEAMPTKIEGTSLRDLATSFNILHNAERLERGQSTSNVGIAAMMGNLQELEETERKLKAQLGLSDPDPGDVAAVDPDDGERKSGSD